MPSRGVQDTGVLRPTRRDRCPGGEGAAIRFGDALGASAASRELFSFCSKLAISDVTALLEGETGTGKTSLARCIHEAGARSSGPFVVVDCASIPETLMEAELFGHEKGAFTTALVSKPGAFEAADGGTLLLDELGELPLELQPKLLGVLEQRRVKRIGGIEMKPVDVRIVATTNQDLRLAVVEGRFRADLFFRLNVIRVRVPPLRERPEDILALATYFYRELRGEPEASLPGDLAEGLVDHDWPGNARELRNAVERAIFLADCELSDSHGIIEIGDEWRQQSPGSRLAEGARTISTTQRGPAFSPDVSFKHAKDAMTAQWEKQYTEELLCWAGGNISRAARAVEMDRTHLRRIIQRHGIDPRRWSR